MKKLNLRVIKGIMQKDFGNNFFIQTLVLKIQKLIKIVYEIPPKSVLLQTVKPKMKFCTKWHFIWDHTVCYNKGTRNFQKKNTIKTVFRGKLCPPTAKSVSKHAYCS